MECDRESDKESDIARDDQGEIDKSVDGFN